MAHSLQARKRIRQNATRNALKASQRSQLRTSLKRIEKSLESKQENHVEETKANYAKMVKLADQLQSKKVVHKNKVSRLKSRINKRIKNSTKSD